MEEEQDIQSDIVKQKQLRDAQENKEFDDVVAGGTLEDLREGVKIRQREKSEVKKDLLESINNPLAKSIAFETTANVALDTATGWFMPAPWLYAGINFVGSSAINIAAQRMRGQRGINLGEVGASGLISTIPYMNPAAGRFSKLVGQQRSLQRAAVGGGVMAVAHQQIEAGVNEGRVISPTEAAIGLGLGGATGVAGKEIGDQLGKRLKFAIDRSPLARQRTGTVGAQKNPYRDTYHLADFDDTEILFTTPDPKSFKKSDVISWDKSKILKQEQKLKANERARQQAYDVALQQVGGDRSKISRKVYEQYAGAINISEVEQVAKRTGHNVADVVKYIEHNEYQLKQLNSAKTLLNNWARRDTVDTMRATIAKYANDKKIVNSKEYQDYVKLAKSLDNATSGVWTKGHKDAIKAVYMRGEFGGNRISNLMLEEGINSIFTDATTGKLRTKKGNIAKQDRPVDKYTLVNLAGVSWDLTDDFLKVVNPRSVLVDMDEGLQKFGDQYTDIALNAYDKLIAEFLQANSIKLNSRKAKTASRAITDGLVAWFKLFDAMQTSGVKDLKSKLKLPIGIDNAKDYWFRNENTIGKRTQKRKSDPDQSYEVDLLEREFIKAFKRIWDNTK